MTLFNILAIGQAGRLSYEAVLLVASLRARSPDFPGRIFIAEPQPGPLWRDDPRISDPQVRAFLKANGAEILPFANRAFGQSYPYGNKIEALAALPPGPFLFLDTDTLILSDLAQVPFDFAHPSASMRREGTWPTIEAYGPGYGAIWKSLYDRFGLDYASSLDLTQPDEYWQRNLYFNAGWFFGANPQEFGARFTAFATSLRDDRPQTLALQELNPWLDQIALPLVIHSFGGTRPGPELAGLDGTATCHYRTLPLLYARESDAVVQALEQITAPNPVKKVLKVNEPFRRMLYQGKGAEARALFDRANLPPKEQSIRNRLKAEGLWLR